MLFFAARTAPDTGGLVLTSAEAARQRAVRRKRARQAQVEAARLLRRLRGARRAD